MKKILNEQKSLPVINLITVGFFSILSQVIILRELNVAFYGIELIYVLSLGFWLIGTAIGASVGKKSFIPEQKNISNLFILSILILLIDILFIRYSRKIFNAVAGGFLPFENQIVILLIALIPLSLISGLLFQWSAKQFILKSETLAKAYAIESLGGLAGGILSTLFLVFKLSNFSSALICSLIISIICLLSIEKSLKKIFSIIGLLIIFSFLFIYSKEFDKYTSSWNHPYLVDLIDTPYGRVTISSIEKQVNIFIDDALAYETESTAAEEFVHLSALQLEKINDVLVLGGGFEGVIYELLKLPVKKIDYVEINKDLIDILKNYLPVHLSNSLNNQKVNIIFDDPRRFLKQSRKYDLILVGMPEPLSAQSNRFYTKEFFKQCYNSLNDGVLSFRIRSSENIWTEPLKERNKSIYAALKFNFKNSIALPGVIFIASKSALSNDTRLLTQRFSERSLDTKLVSPQYINYIFTNDRFYQINEILNEPTENVNTDLRPVCYAYNTSIWLSKFFPELTYTKIDFDFSNNKLIPLLVLIFLLSFIFIRSKSIKRFILVLFAGLCGMILETVLIIYYQNYNGILYRDIGLLLAGFMIGLALGAFTINKINSSLLISLNKIKFVGLFLITGFVILNLCVYYLIYTNYLNNLLFTLVVLLLDGFFVASIFSYASLYDVEDQKRVVSQLYAADLIGGSLGSVLSSLLLIPFAGFYTTLVIIIILLLLTIFLV
ncbi:hypothetical protein [Rosettibacter firmus]|uniref:spermine/spermidine synthase domain-containing protein n=1 Tax=Rosettibacter firmus TaxID=3111522 RepID=UPI00336BC1B2